MRASIDASLSQPVIPVVWDLSEHNQDDLAAAKMVFLQGGEVGDLPRALAQFDSPALRHLTVAVHLDLLDGLESNESGVRWLADLPRCDAIITVRHRLISPIRKHDMLSIVPLFLHDGRSVERGVSMLSKAKPDAVEVLPAIATTIVSEQLASLSVPLIGGGLITNLQVIQTVLKSTCKSVSTSKPQLWKLNNL